MDEDTPRLEGSPGASQPSPYVTTVFIKKKLLSKGTPICAELRILYAAQTKLMGKSAASVESS